VSTALLEATWPLDDPDAPAPPRPKKRRRGWLLGMASFVLFAGGLGYLVGNHIQSVTQFDQAHLAFTRTQHRLAVERTDLTSFRRELSQIDHQVHEAAADWATDTAQLQQIQSSLVQAEANVSHQGSDIAALQSCLGGVEQALNALSVGDEQTAVGALTKVASSCAGAVSSNG
jgi:septal ring factor EnvC (AmiA/AmiB activator)